MSDLLFDFLHSVHVVGVGIKYSSYYFYFITIITTQSAAPFDREVKHLWSETEKIPKSIYVMKSTIVNTNKREISEQLQIYEYSLHILMIMTRKHKPLKIIIQASMSIFPSILQDT